jgi:hypothetical protein
MCEFFGKDELRMPSIYWAIISTHPGSGLCKAARKKWGFIASEDGLALAYPVIAAKKDGSALVVYAFSGAGDLPHGLGAANPGAVLVPRCQDSSAAIITSSSTARKAATALGCSFYVARGLVRWLPAQILAVQPVVVLLFH